MPSLIYPRWYCVYYEFPSVIHRVKWRRSDLLSRCDLCVVGQRGMCAVSPSTGDLLRYWNKIESVGLRKRPYTVINLLKHWYHINSNLSVNSPEFGNSGELTDKYPFIRAEFAPHHGRQTGIGVGDGGKGGGHVPPPNSGEKVFFGQTSCNIRAVDVFLEEGRKNMHPLFFDIILF